MKDISSVSDFAYVSSKIADYVVENGLKNCSTESNYIFDFNDVSHLISASDFKRYLPLIADWIIGRDEVLDIDISTGELDIIYAEKYLELYADDLGHRKSLDVGKWHVELLDKNDPYGNIRMRDGEYLDRPVWEYEKPGIAFYDTSQDPEKFPGGQFTYTYFVETLRGTDGYGTRAENGLRLDFDVPSWTVQKEEMQDILHWLDKVVDSRSLESLSRNEEELCVKLENGYYFHIQSCDDGWDYTLYDATYHEIDGGQLDNSEYTLAEASSEILMEFECSVENLTPVLLDDLIIHVEEVEKEQFQALQQKIDTAEGKSQINDSLQLHPKTKDIPERI